MKSLIIVILLGLLVALAHYTRPSERSFQSALAEHLKDHPAAGDADAVLKDLTYKDRFLWIDVKKEDHTLYTGVFGHWFEHGQVLEAAPEKADVKLHI
ncbi:MAG TPA: hypothetical protein VFE58_00290 [Tepidisphaeraceae bacterium]|nr:hypothetical protein [Tepidisphaeraceae bacterium]